jgi:hypothetical protein
LAAQEVLAVFSTHYPSRGLVYAVARRAATSVIWHRIFRYAPADILPQRTGLTVVACDSVAAAALTLVFSHRRYVIAIASFSSGLFFNQYLISAHRVGTGLTLAVKSSSL